jgi:DNA-directed RNA polymerase II subunit RPB2
MSTDLQSIIRNSNPILILKDLIKDTNSYAYKVEIMVGGPDAAAIRIGTPVINLESGEDIRLLFPNEARLRNLTYAAEVTADITVKITFSERTPDGSIESRERDLTINNVRLFKIPVMLHSRYCLLNGKPKEFLRQAGECPHDQGGYFVVGGSEKVLVSRQEQAFNTFYISKKDRDPLLMTFASISSLNPETRGTKYCAFAHMRKTNVIMASLPYIRKPINVFVLFRALGIQSDEAIMNLIFPDREAAEYQFLADKLLPTMVDAHPFTNTWTAINYMRTITKGFSEEHIIDILRNQLFIHVPDAPGARVAYLAQCVRDILRVSYGFDKPTDRDDIRNQRCLTSGFLIQMLFSGIYAKWRKAVSLSVDEEWNYNKRIYSGEAFANIFDVGNKARIFSEGYMSDSIMRAFKGKWGAGLGEEKAGVLQSLSRLSYLDFLSHCRRVVLEFDTGMKLTGPRHLHTSQFGYFCTSETPGGASIGITKNLSILTFISTGVNPISLIAWLRSRGGVAPPAAVTPEQKEKVVIAVTVNNGIIGYTATPMPLLTVLKAMKHTGYLPATVGIGFNYQTRKLFINTDEGRPLRPLIVLRDGAVPTKKIGDAASWRDLIMGTDPKRTVPLSSSTFEDPLAGQEKPTFEDYMGALGPHLSALEYVDPYEHNECLIATFPEYIVPQTTHMEVHPSTMMGLMTSMIPYANHNQSPRNQLSCSQSKQGVSIYATNWQNRYDNSGHILCYPEAPLARTMYYDYAAEGRIGYGANVVLALGMFDGYNQEDGIIFNKDSLERGLFRTIAFRSYEFFEEDDEKTGAKTRIGNPANIGGWLDLRPGLDYKKLDDRGIVRIGEYVDEDTVICGGYLQAEKGKYKDVSLTPQVWTRGRVESIAITINNKGLRLVKIRVVQDRTPELGDKFCLTPDHEVLTDDGWKGIADVTEQDKVCELDATTLTVNYSYPKALYSFSNLEKIVYEIHCVTTTLNVTEDHRLFVRKEGSATYNFFKPLELIGQACYMQLLDGSEVAITYIQKIATDYDTFYCLGMPNQTFMVRRSGSAEGVWTGNSNRHGQKGTMGMMFSAVDMPRTADGTVPDIIVNPHSIPSRMTIAQMLEQIIGKVAGIHGAIGDGTTFMNEGSPAEAIGDALESYGFERTGNEILYDGRTGAQIPTAIFIAPVYAMRLKHMVEDKWQARTTGRKEMRTHQPTGGRGKEGGLRFGELERDAVLTHGISAFIRESIMKRSDGTTIPICTGCGTLPIYNERLGIAVCPVCQGPLKFAGNTVDTLELIPPLTKQVAPIVNVEMPFVLKLLNQELNTFMAGGFRILTSGGGVQHLNVKPDMTQETPVTLSERIIPDSEVPTAPIADLEVRNSIVPPAASLTDLAELAKRAGMSLVPMETAMRMNNIGPIAAAPPADDLNDLDVGSMADLDASGLNTEAGLPAGDLQGLEVLPGALPSQQLQVLGSRAPAAMAPMIIRGQPANNIVPGMPNMTTQSVMRSAVGPTVVVDTSPRALVNEGLIIEDTGAGGANAAFASPTLRVRRTAPRRSVSFGGEEESAPAPAPRSAGGNATITVNKLG